MPVIPRVAGVIKILGRAPDGMTVSQLAEGLGEPISSLHRLLQALVQERLVWQDRRSKRYSLGVDLLELPHLLILDQRLCQVAHPYLERLVTETCKTAFLTGWIQDRAVGFDAVESHDGSALSFSVQIFQIMPFHIAASGKAILAYQPLPTIDELLTGYTFTRLTDRTLTDPETLRAHLAIVREQGYAVCDQEAQVGVTAIASPIFTSNGEVRASVGLCAETKCFQGERWERDLVALRQVAERISVEWGGYRRFVLS
ncbi:MAG: IclR family transcriptional regulator [Anaerolineae bacterium]|nr:IclR family transcriptional regulator [Anaerolineae bacterium]